MYLLYHISLLVSTSSSLGSNTNNQSNAFLSSEDKGANTPKIREILYNKLTSDCGDFNKIIAISKYFSEDLEFRVPSESSTFIAYIKVNILNKPEDWNELLDFVTLKTSTDQTEFPYLKMAFIFALLCFPQEVNDTKHYSRADFFEAICPSFPCIEKKAPIIRDLTDDSNDHSKINESNIGRDDLLEEIAEQLRIGNHVVLYGLGGIGKTFICRKVLWNYRTKYTDGIEYVAWVKYESNLESSLYNKFVRNNIGNTAQRLWCRCAVRFYDRLCINFAGILTYVKEFVCKMPENMRGRCATKPSGGLCAVLP